MSINTLPGLEETPGRVVRKLTDDEDAVLRRYRWEQRQSARRTEGRRQHILANLGRYPLGITALHRQLNTGHMGIYTMADTRSLVADLIADGRARKTKRGVLKT